MSRLLTRCAVATASAIVWIGTSANLPASAGESSAHQNPVPGDAASLEAGKRLYAAHCADCHGSAGRGDGKNAADLGKEVPDLTKCLSKRSDSKLFEQISRGRKPMPGFAKDLSERDRWNVINYLRSLCKDK